MLICIAVTLCPPGGNASWRQVLRFFGLSDFSAAAESAPFSMHVLDVGKADSIYIHCGDANILVDAGTNDRGAAVSEYLKRQGVQKLDLVVATHPHDDHIGGMDTVLRTFPVEQFIMPVLPPDKTPADASCQALLKVMGEKGMKVKPAVAGDALTLGGCQIEILGPLSVYDDMNDNSVVLRVTYGGKRFLLMGDAGKSAEKDILSADSDLSADVLKVGHHGSTTASTQNLLHAVAPRYAAISVGPDTNNLPDSAVLLRLAAVNTKIMRTDLDGTVLFTTDGHRIEVRSERGTQYEDTGN